MKPKSFTLIELVITMAVLVAMGWMGISALLAGVDSWSMFIQRKELLSDGRMAVDRMAREIRMIKNITSVLTADAAAFSFTDTNNNNLSFTLNSSVIERAENEATNGLLDNVSNLSFTYYDTNNSVILTPAVSPLETNIRRIRISITLLKGASRQVNLQTDTWPRNLK
mgnify:CR=1 FL=1